MKTTRLFCAVLALLFAQQLCNAQGQALKITTNATLPQAVVGEAMTPPPQLQATGGKKPYTWSLVPGSQALVGKIAPGLSVTPSGQLVGNATTLQGPVGFTVQVADSSLPKKIATKVLTIAVVSATPKISSVSMEPGTSGVGYSCSFNATDGKLPYTWSANSTLPAGLTLNSTTGVLSGTISPSQSLGNFTLTITVSGSNGKSASDNFVLRINPALEWVRQPALPGGKVATTYTENLTVTGGKSPYSFAAKNGSTLPSWLMLNATTGRLSGTPTAAGSSSFTIMAKDSGSPATTIERTFTLAVQAYGMSVSGPAAISGQQYNAISPATYTVSGGVAPYSWSTVPALPAALSINATTGVMSGNLSAAGGNYSVAVTVKDKGNQTTSQNVTLNVVSAPTLEWVTQPALPGGKVANTYNATLAVTGGKSLYRFVTKNESTLPGGLKLNPTTGLLSGTPKAAGNFSFTLTAKDSGSPATTIERTFTLSIAPYGMAITDNSPSEITGTQFQPLPPAVFSVIGGQATYKWFSTPTRPVGGLILNSTTGILSGVPSTAGNTTIAVRVTDGAGQTAIKNCTIRILPAANLTITSASSLPSGSMNASYSTTLTASGGKPFLTANQSTYYNWSIANRGNLPANFTLNATTGILSGTANAVLTANFTVRVTDASNAFATKNCSLQITAPLDSGDADGDGVNNYREAYDGTDPFDPKSFEPLSVGLVAHYPFDGNLIDDSGRGNDFQSGVGISYESDRKIFVNSSLRFTGANSFATSRFPIGISGNQPRSISFWVKLDAQSYFNNSIVSFGDGSQDTRPNSLFFSTANGNGFQMWGSWIDKGTLPLAFNRQSWNQLTFVHATSVSGDKFYLNGVEVPSTFGDYGRGDVWNTTNTPLIIGKFGDFFQSESLGLDDLRIYNRALTAVEVSQLYSEESGEPNMVLVQGGTLPAGSALANQTVSAFHIARFETTWAEWKQVRTWAVANGYTDLANIGQGSSDNHPVRNVSWYDAVKWLNAKSQMEGLMPVYSFNGKTYKTGQSTPTVLATANGYRLPAETEWEWAARGGVASQGYTYSGSNDFNSIAWYAGNSGNSTNAVGTKSPNELGLYDMSGNVFELCFELYTGSNQNRQLRGGGWNWDSTVLSVSHRVQWAGADWRQNHFGFRYARNAIGDMVTIQGGTLPQSSQLAGQKVQAFQIGRTEVTWGEWKTVRTWAVANGYTDLANVGEGSADNHPVRNVNWYDVVKWSNAKSQMEVLVPVYSVNGTIYKSGQNIPILNASANGYRLLFDAEWEWAARGGILSAGLTYSGSNELNSVAWYRGNSNGAFVDLGTNYGGSGYSGRGTWPVGLKVANELGVFDMSGNVLEWCFDDTFGQRAIRGSDWATDATDCRLGILRGPTEPTWSGKNAGFRLARNIGPKISISGTLPQSTLNQAYAGYTFGVVGSTGDKVWSISEGTLPPGMSFSANGTLSGTPTTAGSYTFVIRLEAGGYWDEVEVEFEVLAPTNYAEMVTVQGGTLPESSEIAGQQVATFQIGKYEVTWGEWKIVRDWAVNNGYSDLAGVGRTYGVGASDNFPVTGVSWYHVVKWCNAKSEKEGLVPVYQFSGGVYRSGDVDSNYSHAVTSNETANGYSLPSEKEWEWAARGGVISQGYTYSGSNDANTVAWFLENSSIGPKAVGRKAANEIGLYDMTGNLMEWCEDLFYDSHRLRGGAFYNDAENCAIGSVYYEYPGNDSNWSYGFRLVRSSGL